MQPRKHEARKAPLCLLVPQSFNRIETRGFDGRIHAERDADRQSHGRAADDGVHDRDRDRRREVELPR